MEHQEEQDLEAEALAAIFDTSFEILSSSPDDISKWSISLFPIECGDDEASNENNHVGCKLNVTLPSDYPEVLPELDVEPIRGLGVDQKDTLLKLAMEEAEQFIGMPAIYSVCEAIKSWLVDNNVKGLDDQSMHAQMMRRAREEELKKQQEAQVRHFESQKIKEELTEAEAEEIAVRKRRAEGTPCTKENFEIWKESFEKEIDEARKRKEESTRKDQANSSNKKSKSDNAKKKDEEIKQRLTGYEHFTKKGGLINFYELENSIDDALEIDADNLDVDEELFDDDSDLDDLDFDDDADDDDSDEEEVDI